MKKEQQEVSLNIQEQGIGAEDEQQPYPTATPVTFLCFKQTTQPRRCCLWMTYNPWLEYLSILMVLLTCVSLFMYKPHEELSIYLKILERFTSAFFIMEMVIKAVALGIPGYLQNSWNKFDAFINFGEVIDYIMASYGLRWQIFKALRPMRLLGKIPSMQVLVAVLVNTMPMLGNVLLLNMLVIHIFSVMGVQLWAGQLRTRCFLGEDIHEKYNVSLSPYFIPTNGEKYPFICSPENKGGMQRCSYIPPYKVDGETCRLDASHHTSAAAPAVDGKSGCVNWNQYYNVCHVSEDNPNMGAINFDNIAFSWISIFQVVTLEGWSEIMYNVMDAHSYWDFLFFFIITIMGSFVMMNVGAVVIAAKFTENMEKKTRNHSTSIITIFEHFNKLKCWVMSILLRMSRCLNCNRVHPRGSDDRVDALGQAWEPLKRSIQRTVKSTLFDRIIMSFVLLCIIALLIEHHEQPKELTQVLQISNVVFISIFFMEMVLKLLAFKWEYFKDRNNIFDFFLVIISLWEVFGNAESKTSVLRALRLLRFMRLLHFMPYLKSQVLVLKRTVGKGAAFFLLLVFLIFIFSLYGMILFGDKFKTITKHGDIISDRQNFDSLHWSMVTVFQVLTQEDWNLVLYNAMSTTSSWATLYFFLLIVLGKHVLLNVLVGIVVESFQEISPQDLDPTENDFQQTDSSEQGHSGATSDSETTRFSVTEPPPVQYPALPDSREDVKSLHLIQKVLQWCKDHEDWSFYVFSPENRFRIICQRVVSHSVFDNLILIFILLSCVTIAIERPGIDPQSMERWTLDMSFYVFSAVFMVEMLLKVLALGLIFGKNSYSRSAWNIIDGLLVILSVVHILISLVSAGKTNVLNILKVLRLMRTFRPLRVIKRAPKLKLAVEALLASVKPIGNILFICCMSLIFFGILGVQLFKGKFHHCLGEDIRHITTKSECLAANYTWTGKKFNFDNFPQALMTLFVMYSKDGWMNIMYDGLDAVGVDQQPVTNYNEWMLLYFIPFMVMSFFLLDMFIGVMVETFHQCQREQKKEDALLLQEGGGEVQHEEPNQIPYYANYCQLRQLIHTLCTSKFLELFVTGIIFLNVFVMSVEHYKQPQSIGQLIEYFNYVFTAIFTFEILLKLVAFGVLRFMKDRLNLLDVAVLLLSILSIVFNKLEMEDKLFINPSILRICRVLRLSQVLKAKKIRVLLNTIKKTLSQVGNICLLFMFFFFIYAALGVELFGKLECTENYPCLGLHRYSNFKHFGSALITLYKVCTGDNWSGILKDTLRECRPGDADCVSSLSWVSPLYFTSFVIIAQFVLVNLVVAVIMQALEDSSQDVYDQESFKSAVVNTGPAPSLSTQ